MTDRRWLRSSPEIRTSPFSQGPGWPSLKAAPPVPWARPCPPRSSAAARPSGPARRHGGGPTSSRHPPTRRPSWRVGLHATRMGFSEVRHGTPAGIPFGLLVGLLRIMVPSTPSARETDAAENDPAAGCEIVHLRREGRVGTDSPRRVGSTTPSRHRGDVLAIPWRRPRRCPGPIDPWTGFKGSDRRKERARSRLLAADAPMFHHPRPLQCDAGARNASGRTDFFSATSAGHGGIQRGAGVSRGPVGGGGVVHRSWSPGLLMPTTAAHGAADPSEMQAYLVDVVTRRSVYRADWARHSFRRTAVRAERRSPAIALVGMARGQSRRIPARQSSCARRSDDAEARNDFVGCFG
jgi:hypothetical protein